MSGSCIHSDEHVRASISYFKFNKMLSADEQSSLNINSNIVSPILTLASNFSLNCVLASESIGLCRMSLPTHRALSGSFFWWIMN